jgi:DNA polymerase (family 10)
MPDKQASLLPDAPPRTTEFLHVFHDLSRREVEPLAFKLVQTLDPFCSKVEVAGSFRRGRETINDLDIVVQPKPAPVGALDSWSGMIKALRYEFDAVTEKQGDKLATLYVPFNSKEVPGHVQVDLYRADPNTWGILLLVRTGSKEFNVFLCNRAISMGLRLQYSQGLVDGQGRVVAGRTEQEVFEKLGLPFVLPQDREVKT